MNLLSLKRWQSKRSRLWASFWLARAIKWKMIYQKNINWLFMQQSSNGDYAYESNLLFGLFCDSTRWIIMSICCSTGCWLIAQLSQLSRLYQSSTWMFNVHHIIPFDNFVCVNNLFSWKSLLKFIASFRLA